MNALAALAAHVRLAWLVVVVSAIATAAILVLVPGLDPVEPRSSLGLPDSYQSVQVERAQADLPSAQVSPAVAVVSRDDGAPLTDSDVGAVVAALDEVSDLAVGGQIAPPVPSEDATVVLVAVPLVADAPDAEVVEDVGAIRAALATLPDGLSAEVTGGPAFLTDLTAVFEGADITLLLVTGAVVALLLFITYRSPLLVVVPLIVVAGAEQVVARIGEVVLSSVGLATDGSTSGITSVLVFGAATDYALLLIARYREQLRLSETAGEAMRIAVVRAGGAIFASGTTVVLAVLALILATTEGNQALGVSAAIGVLTAMVAALVVLPCALVIWGRALFWPFMPRFGSAGTEGRIWARLGSGVARRPGVVAAGGFLVLGLLAAPALGLQTGLSQSEQFRAEPEAVTAATTLARAFPAGALDPIAILTDPASAGAVAQAARGVDGVASAEVGETAGALVQVDAVLSAEPGSDESFQAVRDLRVATADVPGADAIVGGNVAAALDLADAQARDRLVVIPVILALVAIVLVVLLRSLLAPALLMVTVVASYFASVGAGWVLFTTVFDFPALDTGVLLLSFVFLVALGVDYNIFLVTRAREEAATKGTRAGMLEALRVTGGVITSAGVLLAAVFAVLGVLPLIVLTQIGVIVCVGVLLDTLLVRTVVVPALAFSAGHRFWWPARVEPVASDPVTSEPAGVEPAASDPVTSDPAGIEPAPTASR